MGNVVRTSVRWLLAMLALGAIAGAAHATVVAQVPPDCRHESADLRERLESVAEATIDGKPEVARSSAEQTAAWWREHHSAIPAAPSVDARIQKMLAAARTRRPREAARLAVRLSVESLDWCGGEPTMDDRLMRLDLVGMTAWLRAQGVPLDWPRGIREATENVAAQLEGRKQVSLANRLRASVRAAESSANGPQAESKDATRLLDLVDVVERALR